MWKHVLRTAAQWGFTRSEATVVLFLAAVLLAGSVIRAVRSDPRGDPRDFDQLYQRYDSAFTARSMAAAGTGDAADTVLGAARGLERGGDRGGDSDTTLRDGPDREPREELLRAGAGGRRVDINRASEADLQSLPGVGPATARAIADYRRDHARFRSVEELLAVPGIGPKKLDKLRAFVTTGVP